ncbi:MAG TPA: diguanylate cyclase, partial [Burkholderiaceae bacterium]
MTATPLTRSSRCRSWRRVLGPALAGALACVALLVHAAPVPAWPWEALADVHFQKVASPGGPADEVVDGLAQDSQGFVWYASDGGLARWDGYRVLRLRADAEDPHAAPPDITAGPVVDRSGQLWVGTGGGVVARYDGRTGRFDRWELSDLKSGNVEVTAIMQADAGRYFVGTSAGVFRFDAPVPGRPGRWTDIGGIGPQLVNTLAIDSRGQVWVGAHEGLYLMRRGGDRFERLSLPAGTGRTTVSYPGDGRIWVVGDGGVFTVDVRTLSPARVASLDPFVRSMSSRTVRSVAVRADATHLWFPSQDGIVVLDEASGRVGTIRHESHRPDSLPGDNIRMLLRSRDGLVWAATMEGLGACDPSPGRVATLSGVGNIAYFAPRADGSVLLGRAFGSDRLRLLIPGRGSLQPFVPGTRRPDEMADLEAMATLPGGGTLVATDREWLRLDAAGRVTARFAAPKLVQALRPEGDHVWIGTGHSGLWRADLARLGAPVRVDRPGPSGDGTLVHLIGPRVGDQRVIASYSAMWLVDEATGLTRRPVGEGPDDDMPHIGIAAIVGDGAGRLWVATLGNGLYVLSPGSTPGRFHSRHLTAKNDGLPGDNVDDVVFDAAGTAWLSTDGGGIAAVDPRSFAVQVFDRRDGATFGDYWGGSGALAPDGTVLFGSHQGITAVRPRASARSGGPSRTVVTSAQVGEGAHSPTIPADGLTVPADSHRFSVEFAALDYSAPSYNRYRYRLDGVDGHWIETDSTRRLAAYTNLSPGRYLLHLQGSDRTGTWGGELVVPVQVLPAWYQTWWARTLAGLALLALATLVYALLTRRLRRQRARLELAVQRRTQEVVQQKEEVQRQKDIVDQKARELVEANARLAQTNLQLAQANGHLEEANGRLERASTTDALTGLHNRRYLTQCIDAEVAAVLRAHEDGRAAPALSFFMIDLDHFKAVNDVHGHAAGDAVLCEVARRLKAVARESDRLVRWGGEEFLLVARDTPFAEAGIIAERICEAMRAAPFEVAPGVRLARTCSVGFAVLPFLGAQPHLAGWSSVVEVADQALYAAKAGGRDGWIGLAAGP